MLCAAVVAARPAMAKSQSTIFTAERVMNARNNVANYSWAQAERSAILDYAAAWRNLSDEQLWRIPIEQTVPRSIYVHATAGCPIHGSVLHERYGVYGWRVDPIRRPWKVQCPIGGEYWPTNDFGAFYASGKDAQNIFRFDRANRSLLYSTDSSRPYGVDDGTGYVASDGTRFNFIAYYVHWGIWQNLGRSWSQALENLSQAYVLTGDPVYAHKTAILLSRIADVLPSMDTSYWSSRGYVQGDGFSGMGLVLGSIWDAALASAIARAYDAIFPALREDGALYAFLGSNAARYGLTPVDTPERLQTHIEQNALVVLMRAIQQRRIRANEGIHQKAYAEAAIALDDPAATPRWLMWLFEPGTVYEGGGHLPSVLVDWIDRDGASNEASPGYNAIWLDAIQPLADLLEDSPYANGVSLKRYTNFRNFLSFPFWLQVHPDYYPHIGDENTTGSPGRAPATDPNRYAAAFHRYGYPELAQMAFALNGNSVNGLHGSLYDPGAATTAQSISAAVEKFGTIRQGALVLSGYGLATLTAMAGGKPATVWLYSGRQNKHGHWDRLNLGLFAYGLDLMPDLGYPDFPTVDSPHYWGWQNNTVSHNTVVVDARRQQTVPTGRTMAFFPGTFVQAVEVDGNGVYSQASVYHRTVLGVQTRLGFYLVDVFRVRGGSDHLYSFHSGPGNVTTKGLNLATQSGGTYAGANVAYGQFYDGQCCSIYQGSGFQFLDRVSKDVAPAGAFEAEWAVADHWDVLSGAQDTRLKVWSVGDKSSSVAFADGHPPANKPGNPALLRYMLERRVGAAPLTTTFVHIIEPFLGTGEVIGVERVATSQTDTQGFPIVGLRIRLADGSLDTIVHALSVADVELDGLYMTGHGAVVRRDSTGHVETAYLLAGEQLRAGNVVVVGDGIWEGKVEAVDVSDPTNIRLSIAPAAPVGSWKGRFMRIEHSGRHDPFYKIVDVTQKGTVVHLGRVNLVRGHQDPANYSAGYALDIEVGDRFEVRADNAWPSEAVQRQEATHPAELGSQRSGSEDHTLTAVTATTFMPSRGRSRRGCEMGEAPEGIVWLLLAYFLTVRCRTRGFARARATGWQTPRCHGWALGDVARRKRRE